MSRIGKNGQWFDPDTYRYQLTVQIGDGTPHSPLPKSTVYSRTRVSVDTGPDGFQRFHLTTFNSIGLVMAAQTFRVMSNLINAMEDMAPIKNWSILDG